MGSAKRTLLFLDITLCEEVYTGNKEKFTTKKFQYLLQGENSGDIRSRNLPVILYLATVVEQKHRFVIFYLDCTRYFISRPLWKNITDPMLFEDKSRDFEALSHASLSRDTRQPGSKVKVVGRSLNSRVSSSICMLKKHRFRDSKAPRHQWFKVTNNEKRNYARADII